jgi:hypothetical protein
VLCWWNCRGLSDGIDGASIAVEESGDRYLRIPFTPLKQRNCGSQVLVCYGSKLLKRELLLLRQRSYVDSRISHIKKSELSVARDANADSSEFVLEVTGLRLSDFHQNNKFECRTSA